jgi:Tol biopolymer transport system component
MNRQTILLFTTIAIVLVGCKSFKYGTVTSKEEAGMQFKQISSEGEKIVGPYIVNNVAQFRWYPGKVLAIDNEGKRLAFLGMADNSQNVFIKDLDKTQISLQRTFRGDVNGLAFSPDGKEIIYSDYSTGNSNINIVPAQKGMRIKQITQSSEEEFDPTVGASGNQIFFTKDLISIKNVFSLAGINYFDFLNSSYIWSFDKNEKTFSQLTNGFSPFVLNESTLLVTRLNSETKLGEIWLVNIKTEEEYMIMSNKEISFGTPSVSLVNNTVVCVGAHKSKMQRNKNKDITVQHLDLFCFKLDGTDFRQLTYHPSNDACPVWSKDGKKIYFLSQRGNSDGDWHIWSMGFVE